MLLKPTVTACPEAGAKLTPAGEAASRLAGTTPLTVVAGHNAAERVRAIPVIRVSERLLRYFLAFSCLSLEFYLDPADSRRSIV